MKIGTHIIPFRYENGAVWKGWIYPFRNYLTAQEFIRDCYKERWNEEELSKFERYGEKSR